MFRQRTRLSLQLRTELEGLSRLDEQIPSRVE
jgi:hypothetical protein